MILICSLKHFIPEEAQMLTSKIAAAEGGYLYNILMKNAAVIRKAPQDLVIQNYTLKIIGFEYVEYYSLVWNLIEEYRLLLIAWVAGFDKSNYIIDRWGLFNPLGLDPFDHDPTDDF